MLPIRPTRDPECIWLQKCVSAGVHKSGGPDRLCDYILCLILLGLLYGTCCVLLFLRLQFWFVLIATWKNCSLPVCKSQILQKSRSYHKMLRAWGVTWEFFVEDSQILGATVVVHPCVKVLDVGQEPGRLNWGFWCFPQFLQAGMGSVC